MVPRARRQAHTGTKGRHANWAALLLEPTGKFPRKHDVAELGVFVGLVRVEGFPGHHLKVWPSCEALQAAQRCPDSNLAPCGLWVVNLYPQNAVRHSL